MELSREPVLKALGMEIDVNEVTNEISPEEILELHDQCLLKFGGTAGFLNEGLFQSLCVSPYTEYFGEPQYPTIFDKAAKYLYEFAYQQAFCDGNKRTAVASCLKLLEKNSISCGLTNEQLYAATMAVANHEKDFEQVRDLIKDNCMPFVQQKRELPVTKEGRVYIEVPYNDNAGAKVFGAKWDQEVRKWHVSEDVNPAIFEKWPPIPLEELHLTEENELDETPEI